MSASLQGYGLVGALITVCIERFLTIYLLLMVVTQRECYNQIYMYVCVYAHTHIIYIYTCIHTFFSLAEDINSTCDVMKGEYTMCCFP